MCNHEVKLADKWPACPARFAHPVAHLFPQHAGSSRNHTPVTCGHTAADLGPVYRIKKLFSGYVKQPVKFGMVARVGRPGSESRTPFQIASVF